MIPYQFVKITSASYHVTIVVGLLFFVMIEVPPQRKMEISAWSGHVTLCDHIIM